MPNVFTKQFKVHATTIYPNPSILHPALDYNEYALHANSGNYYMTTEHVYIMANSII